MSIKKNSKFYGQNHQSFRKKDKETDQVLISLVKKPQGCCMDFLFILNQSILPQI